MVATAFKQVMSSFYFFKETIILKSINILHYMTNHNRLYDQINAALMRLLSKT